MKKSSVKPKSTYRALNVRKTDGRRRLRSSSTRDNPLSPIDTLLSGIAEVISADKGEAFFHSLVECLAGSLNARYALVGEIKKDQPGLINTIAVFASGKIVKNFQYAIENAPCHEVIGKEMCFFPDNVQKKFPKDLLLREMDVVSYIGYPLFDSGGCALGLMIVMDKRPMGDVQSVKSLFRIFAVRAASEIERSRTTAVIEDHQKTKIKLLKYQKQLQELSSQMSLIEEREKRRIATELHDCIGQTLALAKIKLGLLSKEVDQDMKGSVKEILQLIEQTIKETRTLTFELSPPILDELGFSQAVQWLIDQFRERYGLHTTLIDDGSEKPFNGNISFFLFQAVRELLINIIKHSESDRATVRLSRHGDVFQISVSDNGIGCPDILQERTGFGLFNIRERMHHINGTFRIQSLPSGGTRVTLEAPFDMGEIHIQGALYENENYTG